MILTEDKILSTAHHKLYFVFSSTITKLKETYVGPTKPGVSVKKLTD